MAPRGRSADGFDLQLATNHLGHFALVGLLLERIVATPNSRVVTPTSVMHPISRIAFDDLHHDRERRYPRFRAYAQSKLATLPSAVELDRRLRRGESSAIALAAHPVDERDRAALMAGSRRSPSSKIWVRTVAAVSATNATSHLLARLGPGSVWIGCRGWR